jgi:hypothetical protein
VLCDPPFTKLMFGAMSWIFRLPPSAV